MKQYKKATSELGLWYRKGAIALSPFEISFRKINAVLTDNGTILITENSKDSLSLEEIKNIYGGKIIEIELSTNEKDININYFNENNFPKVKNKIALKTIIAKHNW